MLLGEAAYDVAPGWLGIPIGAFGEHIATQTRDRAGGGAMAGEVETDEALLVRFLRKIP
jgi:hypothetical protein